MAHKRKKKYDPKIEDLNLVPIMNLVVCLIPMVLAGAALVKIGVVNVNAPKFGMGAAEQEESDEKPLNLTVAVAEEGFRLSASGADINEILGLAPAAPAADPAAAAAPAQGPLIPKKGENYDYVELYNKLAVVKGRFPEETIVNLTADPRIAFKHIINVMDVLRYKLDGENFTDLETLQAADVAMKDGKPELFWYDVVFAVAQ